MTRPFLYLMTMCIALAILPGHAQETSKKTQTATAEDNAHHDKTKAEDKAKNLTRPVTRNGIIYRPLFPELQQKKPQDRSGKDHVDPTIASTFSSKAPAPLKKPETKQHIPPRLITQVTCPGLLTLTCYLYNKKYLIWCGGATACPTDVVLDNRCTHKTAWLAHLNLSVAQYCETNGSKAYFPNQKIPKIKPYKAGQS